MKKTILRLPVKPRNSPLAVTIGMFDGMHRGHQELFAKTLGSALPLKAVMTFDEDFKAIAMKSARPYLMTSADKEEYLGKNFDFSELIEISSDRKFIDMEPRRFIDEILKPLAVHEIYVGSDFRYGKGGRGTPADLRAAGFKVSIVPFVELDGEKISTTALISALDAGKLEMAQAIMGRPYSFSGTVAEGFREGRRLGFPTANLYPAPGQAIIGSGVFATIAVIDGKPWPGMTNVGVHPTVNKLSSPAIETNIIGFDKDIYGKNMKVVFLKRLRDELRFSKLDDMVSQIYKDKENALAECKRWLSEYPLPFWQK